MIPKIAAAAYAQFQNQSRTLNAQKLNTVKGPAVIKEGNSWVCNGKTYKKQGSILTCGSASWVGVTDDEVKGIILRDSIS